MKLYIEREKTQLRIELEALELYGGNSVQHYSAGLEAGEWSK